MTSDASSAACGGGRHDDVWADDSEDEQSGEAAPPTASVEDRALAREWDRRREALWKDGYRDGLEDGNTAALKEGFLAGFAAGTRQGFEWGSARGALAALQRKAPQAVGSCSQEVARLAAQLQDISEAEALAQLVPREVNAMGGCCSGDDGCAQAPASSDAGAAGDALAGLAIADGASDGGTQAGCGCGREQPVSDDVPTTAVTAPAAPPAAQVMKDSSALLAQLGLQSLPPPKLP
mmetsp:Transcript_11771/g.30158  ORF Transcript_11771/g.30158 Transcript_11771/m.30158 type:complete len:236 (+) Transcript_11771:225-932(+)